MPFMITIFLSAFLLFQVQPVMARFILPWYGGSPTVWLVCLLFFQVILLIGYTYSHLLIKYLKPSKQVFVHILVLFLTLLLLPIIPTGILEPKESGNPTGGIFFLLAITISVPYLFITTIILLVQHWCKLAYKDKEFHKFSLFLGAGSVAGLFVSLFLESLISFKTQMYAWSAGYAILVFLTLICGILMKKKNSDDSLTKETKDTITTPKTTVFLWISLAATASILLLSGTNQLTQNFAAVSFLWVLPLSLYLISLMISFGKPKWYDRRFWLPVGIIAIVVVVVVMLFDESLSFFQQMIIHSIAMFSGCMICHGELARLKPKSQWMYFYWFILLGGVLGGLFVNYVAPFFFAGYWEYQLSLFLTLVLFTVIYIREGSKKLSWASWLNIRMCSFIFLFILGTIFVHIRFKFNRFTLTTKRDFYGAVKVKERDIGRNVHSYRLSNTVGSLGIQFKKRRRRNWAIASASPHSGFGIALKEYKSKRPKNSHLNVGVIGLGTGMLATYSRKGDLFKFYEINPEVVSTTKKYFTFLKYARGKTKVVVGDARISMKSELKKKSSPKYDMIVVDVFANGAIPVHLLTINAFKIYFKRLKKDGVIAIHLSNHTDLETVVTTLAKYFKIGALKIHKKKMSANKIETSTWALLTANKTFLTNKKVLEYTSPWSKNSSEDILWTDRFSSIYSLLK